MIKELDDSKHDDQKQNDQKIKSKWTQDEAK